MGNLEIERKFIIRKIPYNTFDNIISISQFYISDKKADVVERVRIFRNENESFDRAMYTTKEFVDEMSSKEIEKEISIEEAVKMVKSKPNSSIRTINKVRYVRGYNNFKLEFDEFKDFPLLILEVELPSKDTELILPEVVLENIICEVTGLKEFSNSNLAK